MLGLGLALDKAASRGGGAAFNPLSVTPKIWLDPSDLSTMFQDSAGTTPVTTGGQPVGRINDKSGNGNYMVQATAGLRPTYQTSGGLHWLQFDGTDDRLDAGTVQNLPASSDCAMALLPTASDVLFIMLSSSGSGIFLGCAQDGAATATTNGPGETDFVNGVAVSPATRDGLFDTLNSPVAAKVWQALPADTTAIGNIGVFNYATAEFQGRLYGLIVGPATSAPNRAAVRTYLGSKAGISI